MRTPKIGFVMVALTLSIIAFWGCSGSVRHHHSSDPVVVTNHPGPPPHAPAHGYRHKHRDGVVLVYDSGIGVYVASGHAGVYFYEGSYYRLHSGAWEACTQIDGNWRKTSHKKIPPGLENKQVAKGNKKGKKS